MARERSSPPGQRVVVVGTSGSGKTTLADALARALDIPHVELDAIHWGPDWTPLPRDEFRARLREVLAQDSWVVDGNYSTERDLIWERAQTVVWLDYNLPVVLWRVVRRTIRRVLTGQELWSGNRERLRDVFARDSIVLWALQTHGRRRRKYTSEFRERSAALPALIRLKSPRETQLWLSSLRKDALSHSR